MEKREFCILAVQFGNWTDDGPRSGSQWRFPETESLAVIDGEGPSTPGPFLQCTGGTGSTDGSLLSSFVSPLSQEEEAHLLARSRNLQFAQDEKT